MKYILYILLIATLAYTTSAQLKLIHPNGGETLQAGSETQVMWEGMRWYDYYDFEFSSNGGKEWKLIDSGVQYFDYYWKLPNIKSDSNLVRITQISDSDYKPSIEWSRTYDITDSNTINRLIPTKDRGYLAAGMKPLDSWRDDGWVVKLDSTGKVEWSKNYGEEGKNRFYSATVTSDSAFVIVGKYDYIAPLYDFNLFWVIKLDSIGNRIWEHGFQDLYNEAATQVIEAKNRDLIVCGKSAARLSTSIPYFKAMRISPDGDVIWSNIYGGSCSDFVRDILETEDNGFLMSGYTCSKDGDIKNNNGDYDGWLLKIDSLGDIVWSKTYGAKEFEKINSTIKTTDGGYIAVGISNSKRIEWADENLFWILKVDKEGDLQWEKRFGTWESDEAFIVKETKNSDFLIVGITEGSYIYDNYRKYGRKDIWALKIDKRGTLMWVSNYGSSGNEYPYFISEDENKGATIGGSTSHIMNLEDTTNWKGDFWILKLEEDNYSKSVVTSDSVFSIVNPTTSVIDSDNDINFSVSPNIATSIANTTIELTESGETTLELYDSQGRKLETLLNGYQTIGLRNIQIDVSQYTTGRYFLKLTTPSISKTELLEVQR